MKENEIDVLNVISAILGILNYSENLSQSVFEKSLNEQTEDIHAHLKLQDIKLDLLMKTLGIEDYDKVVTNSEKD